MRYLTLPLWVVVAGCAGPTFTNLGNGVGVPAESIEKCATEHGVTRAEARSQLRKQSDDTAIPCAWLSNEIHESRQQELAAKSVLEAGGGVRYQGGQKRGPKAMRRLAGDDFFSHVESVQSNSVADPFADPVPAGSTADRTKNSARISNNTLLQMTKGLTDVKYLDLSQAEIDDSALVHLKDFEKLDTLRLDKTQVTDAGLRHLEGLTDLVTLVVPPDQVSNEALERLQKALPMCAINRVGTEPRSAFVCEIRRR